MSLRIFREAVQGRQIGEVISILGGQPFVLFERKMLGLEKRLLCMCPCKSEREELRRRIAEDIYYGAVDRFCSWKELSRALRRLECLGFGDVERRAFVAGHFVMWATKNRSHMEKAWRMLEDAERRSRALPRESLQRENISRFIARVRMEHG